MAKKRRRMVFGSEDPCPRDSVATYYTVRNVKYFL
jgi:hypothetical protein